MPVPDRGEVEPAHAEGQKRDVADPYDIEAYLTLSPLGMDCEPRAAGFWSVFAGVSMHGLMLQPLATHGRGDCLAVDHHDFGRELAGDP